jgi:N-acetylglutamate synthase-like GNAT family acetyltransferase
MKLTRSSCSSWARSSWRSLAGTAARFPFTRRRLQEPPALWRIRTTVRDTPGRLAAVCAALAERDVNILSVQAHQLADAVVDEFLVSAPPSADLASAARRAGGTDTRIEAADAHDLVDVPTRVLKLAARAGADTTQLPFVLRELFGAGCAVRWLPARSSESADAARATTIRLADPDGGELVITRADLPFTPAERARARALVELSVRVTARTASDSWSVVLPDGAEAIIRRADRGDLAAVLAMHARCSPLTLRRRYHGGLEESPSRQLESLLATRFAYTLVAELPDGRVAAMGNLVLDGQLAEVALLVEDAWQGHRLGTVLTRRLLSFAADAGIDEVYALTQPDNAAMIALMRQSGLRVHSACENGALTLTGHLR